MDLDPRHLPTRRGLALAALLVLGPVAAGAAPQGLPAPPKGLEPAPRLIASDGKAVAPGRIPDDTSERARALWQRAVQATGGQPGKVLGGFDLRFQIEVRRDHSLNNLGEAQYRFWAERGYLRSEWKKSGRIQLRGPEGDWLIDEDVKTELIGRENRESIEELDEWVAIARNFLALATPSAARIVSLGDVEGIDVPLPTGSLTERARSLDWLFLESPDFRLVASGRDAGDPVYRAYLGLDRENGEVRLALLHDVRARRILDESTVLVEIVGWSSLEDRRIPRQLRVYRTRREGLHWFFTDRPGADLYLLKGGTLAPEFAAEEFTP